MIHKPELFLLLVIAIGTNSEDGTCFEKGCTCTSTKNSMDVNCKSLDISVMPDFTNVTGQIFSIDLSKNRIKSIPLLNEIDGLKTLKLHHNEIQEIIPRAFNNFSYLENIDLSYNQLTNFSAIEPLSGLRYLNISHNYARNLPMGLFHQITELKELKLSGNPLHYVRYDMFRDLSRVNVLELSGCALSSLPSDVFHGMLDLRELDLSNNHFERVPSTGLRSAAKLKILKFNRNPIETIGANSFSKLKNLEILEISDMGTLTEIKPGAFSGLKLLRVLRIARNPHLKVLDFAVFQGLYLIDDESWTLEELILRDNGLEQIRSPSKSLCAINTLDLQGNPWNCDCNLIWTTSCEFKNEVATELKCSSPPKLEGKEINKLGAEDMVCLPDEHLERQQKALRTVVITTGLLGMIFCIAIIIVIAKKRKIMEWWYYRKRGSGAVYYAKAKSNSPDA